MKNRIINYFIQGLLYTTPLALTGYVLYWALSRLDSILPFDIPGLGLLTLLVGITLVGWIFTCLIAALSAGSKLPIQRFVAITALDRHG